MRTKYENPEMKQSEIANQLGLSSSTLQRCRNDIQMLSPYRIQLNNTNKPANKTSNTNFNNDSYRQPDVKRPQLTSNDVVKPETNTKSNERNKNKINGGSAHENIEINEHYL